MSKMTGKQRHIYPFFVFCLCGVVFSLLYFSPALNAINLFNSNPVLLSLVIIMILGLFYLLYNIIRYYIPGINPPNVTNPDLLNFSGLFMFFIISLAYVSFGLTRGSFIQNYGNGPGELSIANSKAPIYLLASLPMSVIFLIASLFFLIRYLTKKRRKI